MSIDYKIKTVESDFMRRSMEITRKHKWTIHRIWEAMDMKSSVTRNRNNCILRCYGWTRGGSWRSMAEENISLVPTKKNKERKIRLLLIYVKTKKFLLTE